MTPALTPILTGAALYTAVSLIVIWRQAVCLRRRWREVADFQAEVARLNFACDAYQKLAKERVRVTILASARFYEIQRLEADLASANARLAPFIAKRERDPVAKRFLPAVRKDAA